MFKAVLYTVAFGVTLGVFTSFGQTYLPDPLSQLANSYSVWLLLAFSCGRLVNRYRWAVLAGAGIQYVALFIYYVLTIIRFESTGFNLTSNIIWLVGGTLIGPIAGLIGHAYAYQRTYASQAVGIVVGVIASEALYNLVQLKYVGEGITFMALAILSFGALASQISIHYRLFVISAVVTTIAGYIGYAYVLSAIFN